MATKPDTKPKSSMLSTLPAFLREGLDKRGKTLRG